MIMEAGVGVGVRHMPCQRSLGEQIKEMLG